VTEARFGFQGEELLATAEGALVWPAAATLIVSDLHLEKGSALARRGTLLPPYDSRATLMTLARILDAHRPRRVICLGDSFHDGEGTARLAREDATALGRLTRGREWIWIAGNHDSSSPAPVPWGESVAEWSYGPFVFRHEADGRGGFAEVSGHFHPKAFVAVAGRRLSGRCFAGDGRRLILPAFGAYTGGLDVLHGAIRGLLAWPFVVHLIGRRRVHTLSAVRLLDGHGPTRRGTT
jgi:hypothetical protein